LPKENYCPNIIRPAMKKLFNDHVIGLSTWITMFYIKNRLIKIKECKKLNLVEIENKLDNLRVGIY